MSIDNLTKPTYAIRDRAGAEGLVYSGVSPQALNYPQAVAWASQELRGGVLASVPESLIWHFEDSAEKESPRLNVVTRSFAAYFLDKGKLYVMFSHNAYPRKNPVLASASKGCAVHSAGNNFKLPFQNGKKKTPLGELRDEAQKADMIHLLPEKSLELTLNGKYANNEVVKSITGNLGQEQETYIASQINSSTNTNYTIGYVWLLSPENVTKELGSDESVAIVRPCWVGGVGGIVLAAGGRFIDDGWARSVVHGARSAQASQKMRSRKK
ncbi:MAG: hypothetical protein Q7K43_05640 [Candidatus Woesearchaeota archaeon]|nr:hypothetical protein [Candidatus Woesearchaeota archaeon]